MRASSEGRPILLVTPSVPANLDGQAVFLDAKVASGLSTYAKLWPGTVRSIFRSGPRSDLPFAQWHQLKNLPFDVDVVPEASIIPDSMIKEASVILASGDNHLDLPLAGRAARLGIPVCFIIEYTLGTRVKILLLSKQSAYQKLKSFIWLLGKEIERRRAFRTAKFLQSNGTPAADAYAGSVTSSVTFFDTRLSARQMATEAETQQKIDYLESGAPLRLVYTGRLERMKGADQLLDVARRIQVPFVLDIFGTGELEQSIRDNIARCGLEEKVKLHKPLDFETALIPTLRTSADLFLCCHVQSDPSCTYLETLGCAVPIIGYANSAWKGIAQRADVGWVTPMGKPEQMANKINLLNGERKTIADKMGNAVIFAKNHSAELEFRRRIAQLVELSTSNSRHKMSD